MSWRELAARSETLERAGRDARKFGGLQSPKWLTMMVMIAAGPPPTSRGPPHQSVANEVIHFEKRVSAFWRRPGCRRQRLHLEANIRSDKFISLRENELRERSDSLGRPSRRRGSLAENKRSSFVNNRGIYTPLWTTLARGRP